MKPSVPKDFVRNKYRYLAQKDVREKQAVVQAETLASLYQNACATTSDINEHLPVLKELGQKCVDIVEFGVRTGVSTSAWLSSQPKRLRSYDVNPFLAFDKYKALQGSTDFSFAQKDVLTLPAVSCDLLFIDTLHTYDQLKAELALHSAGVKRFIVLHDTTTFGEKGELPGTRGLWPAVEEFLAAGDFVLRERRTNNNGLTVLERKKSRKIVFLTCSVGNKTSSINPLVQEGADVEAYAFVDNMNLPVHKHWKKLLADRHLADMGAEKWSPRLITKWYKMQWHKMPELKDVDAVVWIDGSTKIHNADFALRAFDAIAEMQEPFALWPHTANHTFAKEVALAATIKDQQRQGIVEEQGQAYLNKGIQADASVYATACILFKAQDPRLQPLLDAWFLENRKYSTRDQISLPYVCREFNITPASLTKWFRGSWDKNELYSLYTNLVR